MEQVPDTTTEIVRWRWASLLGQRPGVLSVVTLLGIVLVGAWLRFSDLERVGIRFEDDAAYYADARLWHRCMRSMSDPVVVAALAAGKEAVARDRIAQQGVRLQDRYQKPCQGYTILGSVMMFFLGERPLALLVVNAIAGTASILMIYWIGVLLFGRAVGLAAAAFFAMSPYHLLYSRGLFPDATAMLLCLIGVGLWLRAVRLERSGGAGVVLAGLAFGAATTCHYRSACAVGVVALLEIGWIAGRWRTAVSGTIGGALRRWVLFGLAFCVPAFCIEGVFRVGRRVGQLLGGDPGLRTYFESAYEQFQLERAVGQSADGGAFWGIQLATLKAFAGYLLHLQGVLLCILCAIGIILCVRRRGLAVTPATFVLVTLTLLCCQPYAVARGVSLVLPFFALCAAAAVVAITARIPSSSVGARAAVSALVVAVAVLPAVANATAVHRRSGALDEAGAFLSSVGPGSVVVAEDPQKYEVCADGSVEFVSGRRYRVGGSPCEMFQKMRADGVRWVIADPQRWHYRDERCPARQEVFFWWQRFEDVLRDRAKLVFETPHVSTSRWEFLAEGPGPAYLKEMLRRGDGAIRIYELPAGGADRP